MSLEDILLGYIVSYYILLVKLIFHITPGIQSKWKRNEMFNEITNVLPFILVFDLPYTRIMWTLTGDPLLWWQFPSKSKVAFMVWLSLPRFRKLSSRDILDCSSSSSRFFYSSIGSTDVWGNCEDDVRISIWSGPPLVVLSYSLLFGFSPIR